MRGKQISIFIALLLLALFLIVLSTQGGMKPVQSTTQQTTRPLTYVLSGVGHSIKSFFSYFGSVRGLNKENARLKDDIRNLQQQNVTLEQYKVENEILKKELDYRENSPYELISARVISSDPTGFSQMVIITAGSTSGVKEGSAVLSQGVLIGKVSSVDTFTSKVLLITDPQSSIQSHISGTTDSGIVRGSYGAGIVIEMVSQNVKINKGDRVVSAGINTDIPQGLLIGTLGEVQSQKNDLLQQSSVISAVDLKTLSFVSVIKR